MTRTRNALRRFLSVAFIAIAMDAGTLSAQCPPWENIGGPPGGEVLRIIRLTRVAFIKTKLSYIRVSNTDRITFSPMKRLESSILFLGKNRAFISQDPKLRHKAESRIFICALEDGNLKEAIKALPWTFAGLFIDFFYASHIFRSAFFLYKGKLGRFLRSSSRIQKMFSRSDGGIP